MSLPSTISLVGENMFAKESSGMASPTFHRDLHFQTLEPRLTMAASVGWDGPGLGGVQLTYNLANNPSSLTRGETTAAIEKALAVWSSVANIKFTPTNQRGLNDSLDISFGRIDGAGGTLAQAYLPDDVNPARIAGDILFDSSEAWEVGNAKGNRAFDLVWIAVHEIGHALGLDHTHVSGSVLAPSVSPSQQFVALATADVNAIQQLYAKPVAINTAGGSMDSSPLSTKIAGNSSNGSTTTSGSNPTNQTPSYRRRFDAWISYLDRFWADIANHKTALNPLNAMNQRDKCLSPTTVLGGELADSIFSKLSFMRKT